MKKSIGAAAAVLIACASNGAVAAPDSAAVKQTIKSFLAKANAGDSAGALALCTDTGSVVDEFAPFHWGQFAAWDKDSGNYYSQNKITDNKVTLVKLTHVNLDGAHAYVVGTFVYSYKEDGKARKEPGTEAYSLVKGDKGWRINSFAWFGKSGADPIERQQ